MCFLFYLQSGMPSYMLDPVQVSSGPDFSPGQPIQPGQSSSSLGVIGRRSNSELGAIGDPSAVGPMHDQMHNLQMLEAAFYKRPQPSDSERPRPYSPVHHSSEFYLNNIRLNLILPMILNRGTQQSHLKHFPKHKHQS